MTKNYTTIQGDRWDIIALKTLGSELFMDKLMLANTEHKHIVVFGAGTALKIPEINQSIATELPPWKRGGS